MGTERPSNVLFVVLDTVRKDHLTPYGYDRPTSPTLDAFAEEATVFDSAIAQAPWTLPVHASMFTGLYPSQHGADQASPYLDDVATLASILSAAGYDTGCFSSNAWISPYTKLTRGFEDHDSFFEILPRDFLSGPLGRAWQMINDDDRLRELASRLVRMGARAHAWFASGEEASSKTPAVIDRTKTFIEESDSEAGWFAFTNLMDAHLPYYPPETHRERFAPGVDPSSVCQNSKEYNSGARDVNEDEWRDIRGLYDAEIAHADAEVGRLFDWLRSTDRWEDTTVVVCSDHGELLGEHDLYGHEFALYDELINVPLLVKHPSLGSGRRSDIVELLDLYHTTLDALDIDTTGVVVDHEVVPFDEERSLLSANYRVFAGGDGSDPGKRAIVENGGASADYAFVEYELPVIELHHLEEKAAEAGIELPPDHRAYSRMRASRGQKAKYIRADRIPDEGYRVDLDPGERSPVDPAGDEAVAEADRTLALFERHTSGERDAPEPDVSGDEDPLSDADEELQNRLRELGYLE
ncbi:MAG: sulfatase [Halodesulfurarchaeum sp.]